MCWVILVCVSNSIYSYTCIVYMICTACVSYFSFNSTILLTTFKKPKIEKGEHNTCIYNRMSGSHGIYYTYKYPASFSFLFTFPFRSNRCGYCVQQHLLQNFLLPFDFFNVMYIHDGKLMVCLFYVYRRLYLCRYYTI